MKIGRSDYQSGRFSFILPDYFGQTHYTKQLATLLLMTCGSQYRNNTVSHKFCGIL